MGLLSRILPQAIKQWILAELGDTEEKFTRVFHTSADWIVITHISDSRIIEANKGFEQISGYRREEVIGRPIRDFNVWAIPEQRDELVAELMREGQARDYLAKMRTRDGTIRDCLVNCSLIALEGTVNSHAVWIARDITDQLAASEQSAAAFRLTPDCMTISRLKDGTYLEVNSAFERQMGMARKDIVGKTAQELNVWQDPDDRDKLVALLKDNATVTDFPATIRLGASGEREMMINTTLYVSRGEELMISLLHDVTEIRSAAREIMRLNTHLEKRVAERTAELQTKNSELKSALETLNIAKDQLVQSEKLAALGSLVAGVAHELNTPIGNSLTVASTQEEMLQQIAAQVEGGLKRSTLRSFIAEMALATEILMRNLTRAGDLVSSFKHVAVDRTSSKRRLFSLSQLTAEILLTMNPTLSQEKCRIEKNIDESINMDSFPGPLGQVLINLINNAIVHGFESSSDGLIQIGGQLVDEQTVLLQITDNGKGIPQDHLRRVFEPFFTTRLGQGGSGMGLHIVHNLVTGLLGGTISVSSDANTGGTCFQLNLPLKAPEIQDNTDTDFLHS